MSDSENRSPPTYKRRHQNWLSAYEDWTLPRSEAALPLIRWSGLWTIAAALRRRVLIPKSVLGSWSCYPYMYVMFVAPPGFRKTVTIDYAVELLENVPVLGKPPTFTTKEALLDIMIKATDSSVYLTMGEFGDLILKGGQEMFEFLTGIFDGKKTLRQSTMARGLEHVDKPCLNMIAGTTPEWISTNIPAALMGGGFASRVIWVYEDILRQRKFFHPTELITKALKNEEGLLADLIHISQQMGEFTIDKQGTEYLEDWYQNLEKKYKGWKYPGYLNRKHVMALKIAMCLRLAYSDELVITAEDASNAVLMLESTEKNLPKVFQGIGKNTYALEMRDIVTYVKDKGQVKASELLDHFESMAEPKKLHELVAGVIFAGKIKDVMIEGDKYYLTGD